MAILSVNIGSSSIKFALYAERAERAERADCIDSADRALVGAALASGQIDGLEGQGVPRWQLRTPGLTGHASSSLADPGAQPGLKPGDGLHAGLLRLLAWLETLPETLRVSAVAHRVVHGGGLYHTAVVVDATVLAALSRFNGLAPLHQPHNLAGIAALADMWPGVPQIACFDTGFHAAQSPLETRYALPAELTELGVRRYGFHGLSYTSILQALRANSPRAEGRVLMAHLGNGASVCGAVAGQSRASSMGFSALDGLMMGTRCGSLDPGVLLFLLERGWTHDRLQHLLYRQSGLLGVSGVSADMRQLRMDGGEAARFAIDLFAHRVVRECGAMMACMQGIDVLAFSGGIGEHDAALRQQVCDALGWAGVSLDPQRNLAADGTQTCPVQSVASAVEVWVVPSDEGRVAAEQALALLQGAMTQAPALDDGRSQEVS